MVCVVVGVSAAGINAAKTLQGPASQYSLGQDKK